MFLITCTLQNHLHSVGGSRLPYSAGPGPMFSFGQGIQPEGIITARFMPAWVATDFHTWLILHNHYYYGATERFTAILKIPIIPKWTSGGVKGQGLGNVILEEEVVVYQQLEPDYRFRITQVGQIVLPTNMGKVPTQDSLFASSFFLGVTISNATPKIYQYAALGAFIPTTRFHFNWGAIVLYDFGFGYAIINTDKVFFNVDVEFSGAYQQSSRTHGIPDYTTGGNIIWLGPTFRVSTKHSVIQAGWQYPCSTHFKVKQINPINYRASVSFAGVF